MNREGIEIAFYPSVKDLNFYLDSLGPEDAVVLEASTGSFWWADYIEARGITCFVLNPYRFKIIKALWVYRVTGEFGLPTIYKPSIVVRELRKLFTYYNLLNRQIRMVKNGIQALLTENGIKLEEADRKSLLKKNGDSTVIQNLDLTPASILIISGELELLQNLLERKEKLTVGILLAGAEFQKQVDRKPKNPAFLL